MNLLDREIVRGYCALRDEALKACRKGDVDTSIASIQCACAAANELNWMFHDEDVSELMDMLSAQMLSAPKEAYEPNKKRVAFYDQYGKPFILALQYIDALSAAGYEILYVLSDYVEQTASTFITDELRSRKNITVEVIPNQWSYQQRAQKIQELTLAYCPARLFMHVKCFSVFNIVLPSLPKECVKYYIDLQDHAMWVKNRQLDYVMPYRPWGATIDIEKRGFKPEQVLHMPYYPIVRENKFEGFPEETKGKVVIFTGGDFYKTIDTQNSYWRLVKQVLKGNPKAIILYAGKGGDTNLVSMKVRVFEDAPELAERFVIMPFRRDINEVFAHCDIYMGTSPMSGGLMCQYAAYNSKPILQYYPLQLSANNETEQVINYNGEVSISFTNKELFLKEAKHLIDDAEYRKQRGKENHDALITEAQFNELLARTIDKNINQVLYKRTHIDYEAFVKWWLYLENHLTGSCRTYLLSLLKRKKYLYMPLSAIRARIKKG